MSRASELIGSTPAPAVSAISLPVHHCLSQWVQRSEAPPIVLVACSGGADSLALAVSAIDSAHRLGCQVHTVTVDHGVRDGSADEAHAVASYLETLGAHAHVSGPAEGEHAGFLYAEDNAGPEGNARALRYQALLECAARIRQDANPHTSVLVLLGHTMDDQAETVLLRLARGSGVGSLKAMAEVSVLDPHPNAGQEDGGAIVLVRPLLSLRRADTQAFCAALDCPVVDDPTNALDGPWRSADGSPLRRSAIRHSALPAIREALGMDPVPTLARTAALARDDDAALTEYADRAFTAALFATAPHESAGLTLAIDPLREVPAGVRRRVLRRACLQAGATAGRLSAQHLTAVDDLITNWNGQGPLQLPRLHVTRHKTPDGQAVISFLHTSS